MIDPEIDKWLAGALALILLFIFVPGFKKSLKSGRKGSKSEWMNVAFVLSMVLLFVLLMIMAVQSGSNKTSDDLRNPGDSSSPVVR